MAWEDLSGSSGFTSESDGASANLDITMSDDSARNLWDVQAAIQQIATDFQTAVRSAADFQSYLISIRETGQTVKMPSLGMEAGESGGNMPYAGGRVDPPNLGSAIQSEMGMASRIGEMEENSSGAGGGAMGARSAGQQPADVGGFVSQMTNAGWMASMTGQRQMPQATSDAFQQAYAYAQNPANQYDPQVMGATFNGQTGTPHAYAASQILSQGLPAAQQFLRGGGAGGIASMLGRLGTYGAIGYAGYQLVSAGMETYAQSRSLGLSSNNSNQGAGWGFGQRLGQAGMALSPYLSQEEASQIYNTAIAQGWASRDSAHGGDFAQGNFGSAVNFMYTAAKDYNMDPAMSAQLLQTNALGAGQSVNALAEQILTLKQTLDGTGVSMDVMNSSFASFTSMLISSGASPGVAAQIAGGALSAYAGNTYLGPSGRGAQIVQDTLGQQQTQNVLGGLTGTIPGAALSGTHGVASSAELQKLTARFSQQVMSMSGIDMDAKAAMFAQLYNGTFGTSISQQDSLNMIAENTANKNLLTQGQRDYLEKGKIGAQETQSGFEAWRKGLDTISMGHDVNRDSLENVENREGKINAYKNSSPEVNKLLESAAGGGTLTKVVLYGPDGKQVMVDGNRVAGANIAKWFDDTGNYDKFKAGGYYIQDAAGSKYDANNIGTGGSDQVLTNDQNNSRMVTIQLSPEAKKFFETDKNKVDLSDGKYHS